MRVYFNSKGMKEWTSCMFPTWKGYTQLLKEWLGLIREVDTNFNGGLVNYDESRKLHKYADGTYVESDMSLVGVLLAPISFVSVTSIYIFLVIFCTTLLPLAALYNIRFNFRGDTKYVVSKGHLEYDDEPLEIYRSDNDKLNF